MYPMPKHTVIGLDVGGTKIKAAAVFAGGKTAPSVTVPTLAASGKGAVLAQMTAAVREAWVPGAKAIGVGMAGLVNHAKGVYRQGPNFPKSFKDVPVAALLKKAFKVPVTVDNDVHCFTLAEAKFGAGKRFSSVVGLTLGTGVGGGFVIDGRLYRGRNNGAGEFGHATISLGAEAVCGCGQRGHLEAFASGSAMRRLYAAATGKTMEPSDIERAAEDGDLEAGRVVDVMAEALAEGFAGVIHSLNPDAIVVGGGMARADVVWKPAVAKARKLVIYPDLRETPIVRAALGGEAGVIGAALITDVL